MKKVLMLFFLVGFYANSQNLSCADFRQGKFFIPIAQKDTMYYFNSKEKTTEKVPFENKKELKKYMVWRNPNKQIEYKNDFDNANVMHEKIKWINQCDYILVKDGNKQELDENDTFIINNGGLVVEKIEISQKCMKYKSSLNMKNGDKIYTFGKICKL